MRFRLRPYPNPFTLLFLGTLVWMMIILWPHLIDYYRVPIDVQNHYWMAKFQDPSLFPKDPLSYGDKLVEIEWLGSSIFLYPQSPGYALLFWMASFVISPILFGKLVVFLLFPITLYYLTLLGKEHGGSLAALSLGGTFTVLHFSTPDSLSMASGLQRAFAIPIFIIFIYYLGHKNYPVSTGMIFLGSLFYLPVVPVMAISYLGSVLIERFENQPHHSPKDQAVLPFVISVLMSGAVAFWALLSTSRLDNSGTIQKTSLLSDPRYKAGGAVPFYHQFPWIGRAGLFETYPEALVILVILATCVLFLTVIPAERRKPVPDTLWYLLAAGFMMFVLANLSIYLLSSSLFYMPSRYLRYPLYLISIFYLGLNLPAFAQWMVSEKRKWGRILSRRVLILTPSMILLTGILFGFQGGEWIAWSLIILVGIVIFSGFLIWFAILLSSIDSEKIKNWAFSSPQLLITGGCVVLLSVFLYSRFVGYGTINPSHHQRNLYSFAEELPEDVLFAGSPEELTALPLFAKRKVLFRDLRPRVGAPVREFFSAYYAEDKEEVLRFCGAYGIDYLVLNEEDYSRKYLSEGEFFYQPYNPDIIKIVESRQRFLLPAAEKVFQSGPLGVMRCDAAAFREVE